MERDRIADVDLVRGHAYLLRSRNLLAGVFDADSGGFVGIREKFGPDDRFLDFEYLHTDSDGTAMPLEDCGPCPVGDLRMRLESRCCNHDRPTGFRRNGDEMGGVWMHLDDESPLSDGDYSYLVQNAALYDWLRDFEAVNRLREWPNVPA